MTAADPLAPQERTLSSSSIAPSASVQQAALETAVPFVAEQPEAIDLAGVELFLHAFDGRMSAAPLRSSRFTIEPGCGTPEDRHAVHEIWFVSHGLLDVCYDGVWHRVAAGQAVFFEPWKPHFTRNVGDAPAQIFSVWWE